jgi:hypothetical protein
VQRILGVEDDGIFGTITERAFHALATEQDEPPDTGVHAVLASSFADPADIAAFRRCKARGFPDRYCFRLGDNGIGLWGDDTTVDVPMCALPREKWSRYGDKARGKLVEVSTESTSVVCELRDTMPRESAITNGAGIDLNDAACRALGLRPPVKYPVTWRWA